MTWRFFLLAAGSNGRGCGWWIEFLTLEYSISNYRTFIEFGWSVCHFTSTEGPYLKICGFDLPSPRFPWRKEVAR